MPDVIIQTAHAVDRIKATHDAARAEVINKIGIQVDKLEEKDFKKYADTMTKNKKALNFVISFDGQWFSYFALIGTFKDKIVEDDVGEDPTIRDREKVIKCLLAYGAANKAQVDAFRLKYPDEKALGSLKSEIDTLEKKIADDQKKLQELKKKYQDSGGK